MKRLLPAALAPALFAVLVYAPLRVSAGEPAPEALRCFRWFATLEFPDIEKAPLILYTDGKWWNNGKGPEWTESPAFLIEETDRTCKILTFAPIVKTLEKTPPATPGEQALISITRLVNAAGKEGISARKVADATSPSALSISVDLIVDVTADTSDIYDHVQTVGLGMMLTAQCHCRS